MKDISKAVLDKVTKEAKEITDQATNQAQEELKQADKILEERKDQEKQRKLQEAEDEAARLASKSSIEMRQNLVSVKAGILDQVLKKVRDTLDKCTVQEATFIPLLEEALTALDEKDANIYVAEDEIGKVKNILKKNQNLGKHIKEVRKGDFTGGFVVESLDGNLRIDETYAARLEMLLPRILPDINKRLFQSK